MDSWVLVVVVVVVVVVVERGSGPVSGLGCNKSFSGVHLCCFVFISSVLAISYNKDRTLFVMFWRV